MKISTKLVGISCCSAVIVIGIVVSLLVEIRSEAVGYNNILQGPAQEAAGARQIQVDFEKQVQAWNDVLLREQDPGGLDNHIGAFHELESRVRIEALALAAKIEDPATRQLMNDFLAAHQALGAGYQSASDFHGKGNFDFKKADRLMRGQDLVPAARLEQVVLQLDNRVTALAAAQRAETVHQLITLLVVFGGILVVDSFFYCSVLFGVFSRLSRLKVVSDHLAKADIQGLSIDISGNDEIGEIGESMKGVAAAIEELLAVHAH